jgi:hypothetical protein
MTFTSSALESEKQDLEFGIQAGENWKSETGNLDSQFPTLDFRPPESWFVNLDSGVFGGCSVCSFSDFWILTPDLNSTLKEEKVRGETRAARRHPLPTGEGKERKGTSHHATQDPLPPGQDGACRACQISRVRFTSRHTET